MHCKTTRYRVFEKILSQKEVAVVAGEIGSSARRAIRSLFLSLPLSRSSRDFRGEAVQSRLESSISGDQALFRRGTHFVRGKRKRKQQEQYCVRLPGRILFVRRFERVDRARERERRAREAAAVLQKGCLKCAGIRARGNREGCWWWLRRPSSGARHDFRRETDGLATGAS